MELWGPYTWPYLNRVTGIVTTSMSGVVALYITGFGACLVASKGGSPTHQPTSNDCEVHLQPGRVQWRSTPPEALGKIHDVSIFFAFRFFCVRKKHPKKNMKLNSMVFFYGAEKKTYPKHMKLFFWWQEWEVRESRIKFCLPWGSGGWCTRALARPDWGRIIWWDTSWTPTSF